MTLGICRLTESIDAQETSLVSLNRIFWIDTVQNQEVVELKPAAMWSNPPERVLKSSAVHQSVSLGSTNEALTCVSADCRVQLVYKRIGET